jgi:TonB family protein
LQSQVIKKVYCGPLSEIVMRRLLSGISGCMLLFLILACGKARADGDSKQFVFANPQYVITAEVASEHSFVLNFINLSDFVIVVQPNEFIYRVSSDRFFIGQVFEQEHKDQKGELQKYSASVLLKGRSFIGLTVVGAFHDLDQIEELSVRIGAKRFYLQPTEKVLFDQLAAKIGELDLHAPSGGAALQEANIPEFGSAKSTDGTSEWDHDWQGLITPEGVNPPKIIERPEISPTEDARKSKIYGKVKIFCLINKNGGVQDLKVIKGLGHGLDQKAMDAVKNSWLFLPATKNGEVLDTSILIDVEFAPAAKKQ